MQSTKTVKADDLTPSADIVLLPASLREVFEQVAYNDKRMQRDQDRLLVYLAKVLANTAAPWWSPEGPLPQLMPQAEQTALAAVITFASHDTPAGKNAALLIAQCAQEGLLALNGQNLTIGSEAKRLSEAAVQWKAGAAVGFFQGSTLVAAPYLFGVHHHIPISEQYALNADILVDGCVRAVGLLDYEEMKQVTDILRATTQHMSVRTMDAQPKARTLAEQVLSLGKSVTARVLDRIQISLK